MMNLTEKLTGFRKLDFDYWYFVFIILMFGSGTKIFSNFDPRFQPFSFALLLFFLFGMMLKSRNQVEYSKLLIVIILLIPWFVYHFFVDTSFQYGLYATFLLQFLIGFFAAFHFKEKILVYYEEIVVTLALLSLPFWVMECMLGKELLSQFALFANPFDNGSSFIVYTTLEKVDFSSVSNMYYGLARNAGFTWEPGRFASAIILAMASHIVTHRVIQWKSWSFIILLVTLATTLSTTGYASFLVLIGVHYLFSTQVKSGSRLISILLLGISVSYIMGLSFMEDKIRNNSNENNWQTNNIAVYDELSRTTDQIWCVDRAEGLYLDWLNLQYKPFLGTGLAHNDTYLYTHIAQNLTTSNGLLKPLSQLGLILGIPAFILLFIGTKRLSRKYHYFGLNIIFVITLVIQISYNFMFTSLFFSLMSYSLVMENKLQRIITNGRQK